MERSRRAPRLTLDARVEGHAEFSADVHIVDLSASGALLESARPLTPGSELTIEVRLSEEPVSLRAKVVHTGTDDNGVHRAGVHFVALAPADRDRIEGFLRETLLHERRERPRIFVGQPAQLKKEIELRVLNLSLLGGLFSVSFPLEFRSEHDFVFTLPAGEVHARGVVRHCEAWAEAKGAAIFRLGVEFTQLTGADRERVVAYLQDQVQGS